MRHAFLLPTLALLLAACAQQPLPPTGPAPGICYADAAQFAVGQPYTDTLGEQARTQSSARLLRVLRVGEMATMEFNPERLTIQLDGAHRVGAARCG